MYPPVLSWGGGGGGGGSLVFMFFCFVFTFGIVDERRKCIRISNYVACFQAVAGRLESGLHPIRGFVLI